LMLLQCNCHGNLQMALVSAIKKARKEVV
jgi:hypothetical protein